MRVFILIMIILFSFLLDNLADRFLMKNSIIEFPKLMIHGMVYKITGVLTAVCFVVI